MAAAQMGECRGGGGGGGDGGLIKLFGQTIPVLEAAGDAAKDLQQSGSSSTESNVQENAADSSPQPEVVDAEDPAAVDKSSPLQSGDDLAGSEKEKLKKPDKIQPCPRCNSMDTKFCYFNNYNVNQPRHFCKNCQRYWTAGGAMRNVPVGAGRRKNKNAIAASHFLQSVRAVLPGDTLGGNPPVNTNGTVLNFSNDASSTLDLAEQMPHPRENLMPISLPGNAGDNPSMGSCSEVSSNNIHDNNHYQSNSRDKVTVEKSANGVQEQGINGATMWPYGCAAPPPAAYYTSGIAIPIYHGAAGYWGCMVPGAWSLPWPVQCQSSSSPTSAPSVSSAPSSFTPGKHPREEGDEDRSHGHGKVWVPKTIRIDNADEVAKSSIRSLFGIKHDNREETDTSSEKLATVFEPKQSESKMAKHAVSLALLHHANPVALTRSVTFHERS